MVPFSWPTCSAYELLLPRPQVIPFLKMDVMVSNLEINSMVLGFFAGFIAPFGGFFASGVKRAFKIKDFGDSIPGHGGMTDRMDCQILMGMFTCVWINTMLNTRDGYLENIMTQISLLSYSDQVKLMQELKASLLIE